MSDEESKPKRKKPDQHCFRTTCEDTQRLEKLAKTEGASSIGAWAWDLVDRRARQLEWHLSEGTFVTIQERNVPYNEVPGSDPMECRLLNAQRVLMSQTSGSAELDTVVYWLAFVEANGTAEQIKRASQIKMRLSFDMRNRLDELKKEMLTAPF